MTTSAQQAQQQQQQLAAEAYAFRQLVAHLQGRKDVQNIEMMILTGFCAHAQSPLNKRATAY